MRAALRLRRAAFQPRPARDGFVGGAGHAGDLPNVFVPESGKLTIEVFAPGFTVGDGSPVPPASGLSCDPLQDALRTAAGIEPFGKAITLIGPAAARGIFARPRARLATPQERT